MMKKLTAWLLLAALLLTLTACASTKAPDDTQTGEDTAQTDAVTTPETEETGKTETPDVQPEDEDKSEETGEAETPDQVPATEPEDSTPADTQPEENTPAGTGSQETETKPEPQPEQPAAAKVDLAAVRTDILTQLGITDPLLLETDALLGLYGIESSEVAQSAGFATMAGTFPDEVVMIEAADDNAVTSIQQKLQTKLDQVLVQSESYDPDNYKAAQSCSVRVNGRFVALFLSPKQADMAAIYANYVS